jgi:pimeloyl-ACP methyl ester carboxylesterase/tetratricopeptide (TPR) repeat protein
MMRKLIVIGAAVVVAAASVAVQTQPEPDIKTAAESVRFTRVELNTGVVLQVAERGPVDGEPLLLLHGFTDSWFSYSPVLDRLPANYRAIVPSQRGHGDSDRPACCYRLADFAADAVALLDALKIERATVVGHSMGSIVAQRVAIEHPDRVSRLVLVASAATVGTETVLEFIQAVQALTDPIAPEFIRDFQASTAYKPLPPAFFERVLQETSKLPARVWRETLSGLVAPEAKHALQRIHAPTLIVWGDKDTMFDRAQQDSLVRLIPDARLLAYKDIAHSPNWEQPDRFVADLLSFLEPSAAASARREHGSHTHAAGDHTGVMPLLPGLGEWHHEITTRSLQAQQYFDQGLRLAYGFNHDEAVRSFERATQLDSSCAMCYWGIAYALGPNINLPVDSAREARAFSEVRRAVRLASAVTPKERALIDALALRFGKPGVATRGSRDSAYAAAMQKVAKLFPTDADAQVLFADAMLNLRPWNQWTREGRAQPGTSEVVSALESALALEPNHAGACHFYVHAVEASPTPERALPCAERLPRLMPGAGHIVHMPAHTYLRVGRYEDAARANIAAVEADNRYFTQHSVTPGIYPMFYAPHNLHFLWAAYMLSGQQTKALQAAAALVQRVKTSDARANAGLQAFLPTVVLTHTRFSNWAAVLAEPKPASDLRYVKGMWHYARGVARAARSEFAGAAIELDSLRAIALEVPDDMIIILNSAPALLELATEVLSAEIAANQKQFDRALAHLHTAVRMEDALSFDEPPPWYRSTRNLLGEVLLKAGRTAEAEQAFQEDLRFVRETGWSLAGLERALRANGKKREAAKVLERLNEAWKYADSPTAIGRRD